ncbi:MAG: hypothetical protein ACRDSJ_21375 [Rubrobacteraceae bacterium]
MEQMAALSERMTASPEFTVVALSLFGGWVIGLILLAVALRRARAAALWVTGVIVVGVVTDTFSPGGKIIEVGSLLMVAVGFGWVGLKVLAMSDEERRREGSRASEGHVPVEQTVSVR